MRTLGHRLARHGATYATGRAVTMVLAIVQLGVLTRLLPIEDFGRLALLLFFGSLVTLVVRLSGVQGTIRSILGGGGDDEEGDDDVGDIAEDARDAGIEGDPRRILGTGLCWSLGLTALLTLAALAVGEPLGELLIGETDPALIAWATLTGGLVAIWRLIITIARYERRPGRFVALNTVNVILRLTGAIVLIEAGFGLKGAIAGFALGSAVSLLVGVVVQRHRFLPAFDLAHVREVLVRGSPFILIALSFWVFRSGDLFLISRFLPESDVGLYRVGERMSILVSAGFAVLIMSWGPLQRGPLRGALDREQSRPDAAGRLVTYFWLVTAGLLVALTLSSGLLVRIAPGAYADAQPLIPALAVAVAAQTGMILVYRTSQMARKLVILQAVAVGLAALFLTAALLLIPRIELAGAVVAVILAPACGAAVLLRFSQRGRSPLEIPWRRLGTATLIAIGCLTGGYLAGEIAGPLQPAAYAIAIVAYPVLVVLTGALPWSEAQAVLRLVRSVLPSPRSWKQRGAELERLTPEDLDLIEVLVRQRRPPAEAARLFDQTEELVLERLVAVLRRLSALGPPKQIDERIARHLLAPGSVNERDRAGRRLALEEEVTPLEVDVLTSTFDRLNGIPSRTWDASRRGNGSAGRR